MHDPRVRVFLDHSISDYYCYIPFYKFGVFFKFFFLCTTQRMNFTEIDFN